MSSAAEQSGLARIESIFADRRAANRPVLMPFVCGGHPTLGALPEVLYGMERAGASIVEIGFPFSDPIADGPVIASAMGRAIEGGATPEAVMEMVAGARAQTGLGLIAMVSVSIAYRLGGPTGFIERASAAGFDGFIFPDVPVEEADELIAAAEAQGRSISLLVSPTTPTERAARIARACTGFVYTLARTGITGERSDAPEVEGLVSQLRGATQTPIAVGFGISTSEHVRAVLRHADAAIVGSALVRRLDASDAPAREAEAFVGGLLGG